MKKPVFLTLAVLTGAQLALGTSAWAQTDRAWVDINFGANRVAEKQYDTGGSFLTAAGMATFGSQYLFPQGPAADVGGGVMLRRQFGVGMTIAGSRNRDFPMLSVDFPGASAEAQAITELDRFDIAVHFHAVWDLLPDHDSYRLRVYGGPSYFHVIQETVDTIAYTPILPSSSVNISSFTFSEDDAGGWGGHVGGDLSWFPGPHVGLGGFVRLSTGSVTLVDYSGNFKVKTGRVQYGGGLRLRF